MKLFDERILALSNMRQEIVTISDESESFVELDNKNKQQNINHEEIIEKQSSEETLELKQNEKNEVENVNTKNLISSIPSLDCAKRTKVQNGDQNTNSISIKISECSFENKSTLDKENQNINVSNEANENIIRDQTIIKAVRPNILEIPGTTSSKYLKYVDKPDGLKTVETIRIKKEAFSLLNLTKIDNMTEAQRNKLKVLQEEYGVSPNNNKTDNLLLDIDNSKNQLEMSEAQKNKLKNTNHLIDLNWDNVEAARCRIQNQGILLFTIL
jgi:hypothetical protein